MVVVIEQLCVLGNLCPETAEEAVAMVPSLKVKKKNIILSLFLERTNSLVMSVDFCDDVSFCFV